MMKNFQLETIGFNCFLIGITYKHLITSCIQYTHASVSCTVLDILDDLV